MKRLTRYYLLIGIPFILLLLAAIAFIDEIASTVQGNPHPQINYAIFVLLFMGSLLMLAHVRRINYEAHFASSFFRKLPDPEISTDALGKWLHLHYRKGLQPRYDLLELMFSMVAVRDKPLHDMTHETLNSELDRVESQLHRRLMVAQYLPGLMVGLGLFGTFIGLLGALKEIGNLIGGFAIGPGMTDPMAAVTDLVARLTAPMQAMGVAFSASLFGVLGSMVLGMFGVFVKGATSELMGLIRSRVSRYFDLLPHSHLPADGLDVAPLNKALADLAEHSPLLQSLTVALDQSERRVRALVQSNTSVAATLERQTQMQHDLLTLSQVRLQAEQQSSDAMAQWRLAQQDQLVVLERIEQQLQHSQQALAYQQDVLRQVLAREWPWADTLAQLVAQHQQQQAQLGQQLQTDSQRRLELMQMQQHSMAEMQDRQEQLVHSLLRTRGAVTKPSKQVAAVPSAAP